MLPEERLELLPCRTVEEELLREEPDVTREELCATLLRVEGRAATRLEEVALLREAEELRRDLLRFTPLREAPLPKADAERVLRATLWRPLFSGKSTLRFQW